MVKLYGQQLCFQNIITKNIIIYIELLYILSIFH